MINKDLNILIVEDEVISSEYLLDILESIGYKKIYTATNMESALEIVKKVKIDITFMDINISGSIDGISCAKILNIQYFIPIIFTTAYKDSTTMKEASSTNIFGYLIKPFESNEVEMSLLIALKMLQNRVVDETLLESSKQKVIDLGLGQKYNLKNRTFSIDNITIDLTKNELNILYILCKELNKNVSYNTLQEHVWNQKEVSHSTIRDAISRVKKKTPNLNIQNIINFGYILKR